MNQIMLTRNLRSETSILDHETIILRVSPHIIIIMCKTITIGRWSFLLLRCSLQIYICIIIIIIIIIMCVRIRMIVHL